MGRPHTLWRVPAGLRLQPSRAPILPWSHTHAPTRACARTHTHTHAHPWHQAPRHRCGVTHPEPVRRAPTARIASHAMAWSMLWPGLSHRAPRHSRRAAPPLSVPAYRRAPAPRPAALTHVRRRPPTRPSHVAARRDGPEPRRCFIILDGLETPLGPRVLISIGWGPL
jgi:hypothetical protein